MMKHSILLLLPLLSLAFNLKSELSENCHKKLIFCLQNLKRLNCQNPESFTMCTMSRCSSQEIKVLTMMLCQVNSALSNIEATPLSKHCSSAYRKCWSQAMPPLLLLLDRGETFAALCHAVSSEEFKDCLSAECNKPEKIIITTRSCNPWNQDKVSVYAIRAICYTDALKCLENVTSPTCLTIKHAETCLRMGCYKAEIETIEILMCTTHKTLSLYTSRINEEIPVCSASNCSIKADLPVPLWLSPTELNSRICAGHYPKWDSCIDPTSTECSPQKIQAIIRDTCLPSMYFDVSESCEQHFGDKLASLREHTCQAVRSAEDSLRENCTENEIEILLAGSCESLRHSVLISKHLMDSAPTCYERLLNCKKSYMPLDKLYDPRSHSRNFCWFLSLKSFETCLTSRQIEDNPCNISSMSALISAGCRSRPGVLTKSCSQHALVCIHGNMKSCEDINSQENCLLELCTGIEANHVMRESCTTLNYLAALGKAAAEVPHECAQRIYYCLSHLHFPNQEWLPSSKVEQQFCRVINTDMFIACSLERCLLNEVNVFVQAACMPHFHLLQSITMDCIAQIQNCGSLSLEAACAGLSGMEHCVKQSGQCSPTDIRRIIHQACSTLEAEDGFFLASLALPPDCAVKILNCVDNNKSLQEFQATSADFCAYIISDVFKQCISNSCNSDHYNLTLKASCNETPILYKVKPSCYHRAMICFNSSTCLEADINHNCLGTACTSFENILMRDNFCKTERYIRRLESVFEDKPEHCMSLFLDCALGAQITVDMRFDLKSLQDSLCQSAAKENARQCYVSGADCKEGLYELASVLACSPAGELATSIDDDCIIHLSSCLQQWNVDSCADVVTNQICISQKCNEVATAHVTGRACKSMSFVESILANIEASNIFCREQLLHCLDYKGYPMAYWLDVNMFRRRVCHTTSAESFKTCLLEKCSRAPIQQIALAACDFRARLLGLEALSACSLFNTDLKFVMAAATLPFLSRWL